MRTVKENTPNQPRPTYASLYHGFSSVLIHVHVSIWKHIHTEIHIKVNIYVKINYDSFSLSETDMVPFPHLSRSLSGDVRKRGWLIHYLKTLWGWAVSNRWDRGEAVTSWSTPSTMLFGVCCFSFIVWYFLWYTTLNELTTDINISYRPGRKAWNERKENELWNGKLVLQNEAMSFNWTWFVLSRAW